MVESGGEHLSVEQFAERLGMSVRTVRFYAGRGLLPPPRREGRQGYYGSDHIARLELVRELQAHGFTLSAIEGYLEKIPADASPEQVALHRTLLAPWQADLPETVTREELQIRAGRSLSDDDIEMLAVLGVIDPTPTDESYSLAPAHLAVGIGLLDVGLSSETASAARRIFEKHGQQLAEEMTLLFRTEVWPQLRSTSRSDEELQSIVERFKPLSIAALVSSYQTAVDELKRESIRKRT